METTADFLATWRGNVLPALIASTLGVEALCFGVKLLQSWIRRARSAL